jgi:excisionase family DNA binding protein
MRFLTPEIVAQSLAVSRSTVLRMIGDGSLPAVCLRRGKRKNVYRIREEQLERWVMARERQGVKTERKASTAARPASDENNGQGAGARDCESHAV